MKTEIAMKFKLPKESYEYEIYSQAEDMHRVLNDMQKFLFSGNQDLNLEDIQGYWRDVTSGLKL
jgi:hypothetical protein